MSDVAAWNLLNQAISNFGDVRAGGNLAGGLSQFQDTPTGPGAVPAANPAVQPDKLSPAATTTVLARAKPYMDTFRSASARTGVPVNLLMGVGAVETGGSFNPNLTSPAGAQGLMQFIPDTAREYHLSNPFNPNASINAAADYLAQLKQQYGTWDLALRYYNGVGRGSDPNYVAKVKGYATGPFAGFGGTGGTPAPAAVAGGGGSTPPSPPSRPPAPTQSGEDAVSPTAMLPKWQRRAMAGGDGSSADPSRMTAAADTGTTSDAPPVLPTDDEVSQYVAARAKAGIPISRTEAAKVLSNQPFAQGVMKFVKRMGQGPSSLTPARDVSSVPGAPARLQPPPLGSGLPGSRGPVSPPNPPMGAPSIPPGARPTPPGAGGGGGIETPGSGVSRGAPGPAPPAMASTGVSRGAPGPAPPVVNGKSVDTATDHPANSDDNVKTALAGGTPDPGPQATNENGYFPYHSVYGDKFTLPMLIHNIKKANPGISNTALWAAINLAQPMLKDAAQENFHELQVQQKEESLYQRQELETQREQAQAARERAALDVKERGQDLTHEDRVNALNSLDAYRKVKESRLTNNETERVKEFMVKSDQANQRLFEEKRRVDIQYENMKSGKARLKLEDLKVLLQQKKQAEDAIQKEAANRIRMVTSLNTPDQSVQDDIIKDVEALKAKGEEQIKGIEDAIKKLGGSVDSGNGGNTTVHPASELMGQ